MADRSPPPAITVTNSTTAPVTTTTTYTIGGRRNRGGTNSTANSGNHSLRPTSPNSQNDNDTTEPFPALTPGPVTASPATPATPGLSQQRTNDYFANTPLRYQVQTRPISIRRLPSSSDVQQGQSTSLRSRAGSGLTRRRTNTGPKDPPAENATAGLAGLPGHYEIGAQPGGMDTIREGVPEDHGARASVDSEGENRVGRSGSTRLRRASNAARSVLSKLSDDPEEDNLRKGRSQTGRGNQYESDVVDYLDVLGTLHTTL